MSQDIFDVLSPVPALFSSLGVPWWMAGGWAVDLHVGRQTRDHSDVEVVVLDRDLVALSSAHDDGILAALTFDGDELVPTSWPTDVVAGSTPTMLRASGDVAGGHTVDVWLGLTQGEDWVYPRGRGSISRPVAELGVEVMNGWPVLALDLVLRLKARFHREKDDHDVNVALEVLAPDDRDWLARSVADFDPDHPWVTLLGAQ